MVLLARDRVAVRAREATDEERERLWPPLVELNPTYETYGRYTDREFPIVILRPS